MADKKFTFSGLPGSSFNIDSEKDENGASVEIFGECDRKPKFKSPGVVLLNNVPLTVTRWNSTSIKGELPEDAKPGEVVVMIGGEQIKGYYGKPPAEKKA